MTFTIARSIEDALEAIEAGARPVAGGSDLVVGARHGTKPLPESLVAIDRVRELGAIESTTDGIRIGAAVTHAQLMNDPTIAASFPSLGDASALVGSPATRNVGTLGGNIMNGSPAMDTGAPLMVLDAEVELRSTTGTRIVPIGELWTGPGQTSADPLELCTAVLLPTPDASSSSAYVRLEYRRAMEIAVVGAAASVTLDSNGAVASAKVALTAVAPTIVAVADIEAQGLTVEAAADHVAQRASDQAAPISDLRASGDYRRHTVGVMARRAFEAASGRASGQPIAMPVNRSVGVGVAQ